MQSRTPQASHSLSGDGNKKLQMYFYVLDIKTQS